MRPSSVPSEESVCDLSVSLGHGPLPADRLKMHGLLPSKETHTHVGGLVFCDVSYCLDSVSVDIKKSQGLGAIYSIREPVGSNEVGVVLVLIIIPV